MRERGFRRRHRFQYAGYQIAAHLLRGRRLRQRIGEHRGRLLERMQTDLARHGKAPVRAVDRVRELPVEEFRRRYQRPGIPVVFSGAARDWACCRNWSLAYLADLYGDDLVFRDPGFGTLRDTLESLREGGSESLRFYALLQRHPERLQDLDLHWLKEHRHPNRISFDQGFQTFIGNATARPTPLHNANDANLFIQVTGRKHWFLYPSTYTAAVDPPPTRSEYRTTNLKTAHFDPFAPDFERFPMFEYVEGYEAILEPGDILWNPPYVWHAVRNLGSPTIAVGYRWVTPASCIRLEPLYAFLDCLATDPPVWKSLRMARQSFQLVFLNQRDARRKHPRYEEFRREVVASHAEYRRTMRSAGLS